MIPGMSMDTPNAIDTIFSNVWDTINFLTIDGIWSFSTDGDLIACITGR